MLPLLWAATLHKLPPIKLGIHFQGWSSAQCSELTGTVTWWVPEMSRDHGFNSWTDWVHDSLGTASQSTVKQENHVSWACAPGTSVAFGQCEFILCCSSGRLTDNTFLAKHVCELACTHNHIHVHAFSFLPAPPDRTHIQHSPFSWNKKQTSMIHL